MGAMWPSRPAPPTWIWPIGTAAADIYVRDRSAGRTRADSFGGDYPGLSDGGSYNPSMSSDGSWVAFSSDAALILKRHQTAPGTSTSPSLPTPL